MKGGQYYHYEEKDQELEYFKWKACFLMTQTKDNENKSAAEVSREKFSLQPSHDLAGTEEPM